MMFKTTFSFIDRSDPPEFIRRIVDWSWNWGDVFGYFASIAQYHIGLHGWKAYLAIVCLMFVVGIAFKPTRHLTTLILSALIRGIGQVFALALGLLLFTSSKNIVSMFLSQIQRIKRSFTKAE